MPAPPNATDCVIVGGGPCGSVLAFELVRRGHSVVLVDDGHKRHAMPSETMVPSAARQIEAAGLRRVFAEHEFFGASTQGVCWNADQIAWRTLEPKGRGFQVDRVSFDAALRERARRAGATVLDRHRVAQRLPDDGAGSVRIEGAGGEHFTVDARTIAVAAGRGQHRRLFDSETVAESAPTTALVFVGSTVEPFADRTLVEAVAQGWIWSIPHADGSTCIAVFADTDELHEHGRDEVIRTALDRSLGPSLVERWPKPRHGADCTARLTHTDRSILLCGDAASSIDPLSSQGIEKAIASACAAARVLAARLESPDSSAALTAYHADWERRLWHGHARDASQQYTRETRFADRPFWRRRRASRTSRIHEGTTFLARDDLEPAPAFEPAGDSLREVRGLALPGSRVGLASIGRLPVPSILELVATSRSASEIFEAARREADFVSVHPAVLFDALRLLVDDGFVRVE